MIAEIAKLRREIEEQIGESLSEKEISYFEQIKTVSDLKNFKNYKGQDFDENLAFDAAIALGLSEDEAEKILENKDVTPGIEISEELKKEYQTLVQDVGALGSIAHEAEYQMIEETSAEGFASIETRQKVREVQAQLSESKRKLECFKYENSAFVTYYKATQKAGKEERNEELFERFWNN
jgi:C1A family cysteine protease